MKKTFSLLLVYRCSYHQRQIMWKLFTEWFCMRSSHRIDLHDDNGDDDEWKQS